MMQKISGTAENLCLSATVVSVHDSALADEYAVSSKTLVLSTFIDRQTLIAHFSGVCMRHRASHARCAIVEPSATMCVGLHCIYNTMQVAESNVAFAETRSVSVIRAIGPSRATFQLTQSVARVSRR